MNSLEKEYLDNVERAKARDRRRELIIAILTAGFIRPLADVAIDEIMDRRTRVLLRGSLLGAAVLLSLVMIFGFHTSAQIDENDYCRLFVLAFAGLIVGWKYLYGKWRARRNAQLVLEWERRLDSNGRR